MGCSDEGTNILRKVLNRHKKLVHCEQTIQTAKKDGAAEDIKRRIKIDCLSTVDSKSKAKKNKDGLFRMFDKDNSIATCSNDAECGRVMQILHDIVTYTDFMTRYHRRMNKQILIRFKPNQ